MSIFSIDKFDENVAEVVKFITEGLVKYYKMAQFTPADTPSMIRRKLITNLVNIQIIIQFWVLVLLRGMKLQKIAAEAKGASKVMATSICNSLSIRKAGAKGAGFTVGQICSSTFDIGLYVAKALHAYIVAQRGAGNGGSPLYWEIADEDGKIQAYKISEAGHKLGVQLWMMIPAGQQMFIHHPEDERSYIVEEFMLFTNWYVEERGKLSKKAQLVTPEVAEKRMKAKEQTRKFLKLSLTTGPNNFPPKATASIEKAVRTWDAVNAKYVDFILPADV